MARIIAKLIKMGFTKARAMEMARKIYRAPSKVGEFLSPGNLANTKPGLALMERKARKQIERELLSNESYRKWLKPSVDKLKKDIARQTKEINEFKNTYIGTDTGIPSDAIQDRLLGMQNARKSNMKLLKKLQSSKTRKNYDATVKMQTRNTPITYRDRVVSDGKEVGGVYDWGYAAHPSGRNMSMRGLDISTDPSNPYSMWMKNLVRGYRANNKKNIDNFIEVSKKHGGGMREKTFGKIQVQKQPWNIGEQYRTTVHELKHAAQAPLGRYREGGAGLKHVPLSKKSGRPIALAEAELNHAVLNTPGSEKILKHTNYLLKPQEISARLSELRALNPIQRVTLFKDWKPGKLGRRINTMKAELGVDTPSLERAFGGTAATAYKDLLKVFKTPENISKALRDNWGMAPLGGLLGGGAIGGEE